MIFDLSLTFFEMKVFVPLPNPLLRGEGIEVLPDPFLK